MSCARSRGGKTLLLPNLHAVAEFIQVLEMVDLRRKQDTGEEEEEEEEEEWSTK